MKSRNYKNFDELFYQFNREILLNPTECLDYVVSTQGYVDDLLFKCDSHDCNLNLGDFGFKKYKWTSLLKTMIDKEKVLEFYEELKTTKSNCCIFNFQLQEQTKGGSLICIVLKRHDARGKWKVCDAIFRTAELQRGFAVDLVFLHIFLRDLPDCCKISSVNIFIAQACISGLFINGYLEWFDVGIEEMDNTHPFVKALINSRKKHFTDKNNLSKYNALFRMQQVYFEMMEFQPIRVLDLELGVKND